MLILKWLQKIFRFGRGGKIIKKAFPVTGMDNLLDLRLILQVVNTRLLELSLMGLEVLY
jgi:hypothetical protein